MNNKSLRAHTLAAAAIVGAAYAVLTMALAPISYGAIQLRVSEVLCILPYFMPCTAWGLFIGCAVANLLTGNLFDIVFGSLATLAAALLTAAIGRRKRSLRIRDNRRHSLCLHCTGLPSPCRKALRHRYWWQDGWRRSRCTLRQQP